MRGPQFPLPHSRMRSAQRDLRFPTLPRPHASPGSSPPRVIRPRMHGNPPPCASVSLAVPAFRRGHCCSQVQPSFLLVCVCLHDIYLLQRSSRLLTRQFHPPYTLPRPFVPRSFRGTPAVIQGFSSTPSHTSFTTVSAVPSSSSLPDTLPVAA